MSTSPRILLLGASGYIGGSTLTTLLEKTHDWHIAVLVRNEVQASAIHQTYPGKSPSLSTIIGSLSTPEILTTEATKASIVLQLANGDHEEGTDTLLAALTATSSRAARYRYYIHLSGAATVMDLTRAPGLPATRSWNDTTDLSTILAFPSTQIHAAIEQRVVSLGAAHAGNGLRTAIISPPAIIGKGTGPVKKGAAYHVNTILRRGKGFVVGEGRNTFDMVHVRDVADGIVAIIEAAVTEIREQKMDDDALALNPVPAKADWNEKGYYFLTSGWKCPDAITYVKTATGLLREKGIAISEGLDHLTVNEASSLHPFGPIMFGGSLMVEGRRLRERLGWESYARTWEDGLREQIDAEVEREGRGEVLGVGFGRG